MIERLKNARTKEAKSFGRSSGVCRAETPVALTHEGLRTDGGACPSTLLAQVRYLVPCVAIESFLNMESDGLKAELQQSPTHPKGWSAPFRASGRNPTFYLAYVFVFVDVHALAVKNASCWLPFILRTRGLI